MHTEIIGQGGKSGKKTGKNRTKEREKQLKTDEELARKLSFHINNFSEEGVLASSITTKLQKKSNNKQTHIGDIQEYLSPESQLGPISLSQVVQEGKKSSMSKEMDSNDIKKTPKLQGTKFEGDTPILSSQICLEIQKQSAKSLKKSHMPQLCTRYTGSCLERKLKMETN